MTQGGPRQPNYPTDPTAILESEELNQQTQNYPTQVNTPRTISLVAKKRPLPLDIGYNDLGVKLKRHVLYRNFHEISKVVYLVEISRDRKKIFVLLFENFEKPRLHIGEAI